jgi:tRNA (cmo5U34)-methyltransferase
MSVAAHLKINLAEYDQRVRTFIPGYDHMINAAAAACGVTLARVKRPVILDLGVGTGALSARCLEAVPGASIVGVDSDPEILDVARKRFARTKSVVTMVPGDLTKLRLPPVHAIVATLALHHVNTPARKRALYKRCFDALPAGGAVVSGDFHPSSIDSMAERQVQGWTSHLLQSYSPAETRRFFRAWAEEDTYMTLEAELAIMQGAGFSVDVTWRRGGFAVVAGVKA